MADQIYPNIHDTGLNCAIWLKERAIFTPKNDSANTINKFLLEKLPTELSKYESVDSVTEVEDAVHYPVEFLHTLDPPGLPVAIESSLATVYLRDSSVLRFPFDLN